MKKSFLIQYRSILSELEKLVKIRMSCSLKSFIVNIIYTVPERAVRIRKNKNKKGGASSGESFSMLSFSVIAGENEAIKI
jgi:hypothetical protein